MVKISAIVPAGGVGNRFDTNVKKQFYDVDHKPIIYYTLLRLNQSYNFQEFVIGADPDDYNFIKDIAEQAGIHNIKLTNNGKERANTVFNALQSASGDYVLIHDAVRPFVPDEVIRMVIEEGVVTGGAICGLFARDTIKKVTNGFVECTLDRRNIFIAHTPQVFKREQLSKAMADAFEKNVILTDEASAYEAAGLPVKITFSTVDNIKITSREDMAFLPNLISRYFS